MLQIHAVSRGSAATHTALGPITLQLDALSCARRDISCKVVHEEDQRTVVILFDSFPPFCDTVLRDPEQNISYVSLPLAVSPFLLLKGTGCTCRRLLHRGPTPASALAYREEVSGMKCAL